MWLDDMILNMAYIVNKRATHMSHSIDPNAPKRLDVVERNALLSEPELVEMQEKRQEVCCYSLIKWIQLTTFNSFY